MSVGRSSLPASRSVRPLRAGALLLSDERRTTNDEHRWRTQLVARRSSLVARRASRVARDAGESVGTYIRAPGPAASLIGGQS
jgi:hypothetical protein